MIQAILLAAGKSTRTEPLTLTKPKPLLCVAGTTLIEHTLEQLEGIVKEVIIVVGYKGEMIKKHLSDKYKSLTITYVEQKEQKGTAHALLQAEPLVKGTILVMPADDIFFRKDLLKLIENETTAAILVKNVQNPQDYGVIIEEKKRLKRILKKIIEKPKNPSSNLVSTSCFILPKEIFPFLKRVKSSERKEIELPDAVNELAKKKTIAVVEAETWVPITYAWHLLDANRALLDKKSVEKPIVNGTIEEHVTVKGKIFIGKGTLIKAGTYIEGPVVIGDHCTIGPNAYLRSYTSIGDNCKIGTSVEIKDTIISNNTNVAHLSYLGDSIVGEHVNLGGGLITANLRHDEQTIKTPVKGQFVETQRRKLGAIIGDHVHTGIHTSIYPGRKLWPYTTTMPGEVVDKDKVGGTHVYSKY